MRRGTLVRQALCVIGAGVVVAGLAACDPLDPTTIVTVTTVVDGSDVAPGDGVCELTIDGGDCSLRAAIDEANANAHITQVSVPAGVYSLDDGPAADDNNAFGDLDLDPAAGHLVVMASGRSVVVDAAGAAGGLDVRGGTVVALGVSVMESNSAAAAFTTRAGAALSILYASPYVNGGPAAAFEAGSSGQVLSSTLSTNGAGLVNDGDVQVRFATITANSGPGISGSGTTTVGSSIVVNQQAGPDCTGPVSSVGWNAFGEVACGVTADDTLSTDLSLSLETVDGLFTFVPGPGSHDVRDAIPVGQGGCDPGTNEAVDQAGQARPFGSACDKGAYESVAPPIDLVVDTSLDGHDVDLTDGVCDAGGGACTLRAAVDEANVQGGATATAFDPVTITIADGVTPVLTLDSEDPTSEWDSDPIIIAGGVTIDGGGATIDMGQKERGFEVRHQYLELRDVSIVNAGLSVYGMVSNTPDGGSSGASITLDHALVGDDPLELGYGWNAVVMSGGDFTMVDSSVGNVREHAFRGTSLGAVRIERSTVLGSEWGISASAHDIVVRDSEINGALLSGLSVDPAGHILIERSLIQSSIGFGIAGPFTIRNSTYSDNRGPLIVRGSGIVELSTFADNSAWSGYNDVWNDVVVHEGTVTVSGSVLGAGLIDLSSPPTDYPACATDGTGTLVSGGYNVVADTSCGFAATGDVQGVDPLLAGSGDYGGPTPTRPPDASSPAVDRIPAGTPGLCDGSWPTDQRGLPRPIGSGCDAGSVELYAVGNPI